MRVKNEEKYLDEYMNTRYPEFADNKKEREAIRDTLGFAMFRVDRALREVGEALLRIRLKRKENL